ncbi:hypothetical protein BRADI_3g43735v3, partial [Brachypodium distachyon]
PSLTSSSPGALLSSPAAPPHRRRPLACCGLTLGAARRRAALPLPGLARLLPPRARASPAPPLCPALARTPFSLCAGAASSRVRPARPPLPGRPSLPARLRLRLAARAHALSSCSALHRACQRPPPPGLCSWPRRPPAVASRRRPPSPAVSRRRPPPRTPPACNAPHQPPLPPARMPEQARLAQAQTRSKPRPVPSFPFSSFPEIVKILTCGPCWSAPPAVLSLLRVGTPRYCTCCCHTSSAPWRPTSPRTSEPVPSTTTSPR